MFHISSLRKRFKNIPRSAASSAAVASEANVDLQTRGDLLLFQSTVAKLLTDSKTCGVVTPVKVPIWLPLLRALFHEESLYTATTESRFSGTHGIKVLDQVFA